MSGERWIDAGYRLAAMHDEAGRRGIWYRESEDGVRDVLDIRGGREGDDYHVRIVSGQTLTVTDVSSLAGILACSAWVKEDSEHNAWWRGRVAFWRAAHRKLRATPPRQA